MTRMNTPGGFVSHPRASQVIRIRFGENHTWQGSKNSKKTPNLPMYVTYVIL